MQHNAQPKLLPYRSPPLPHWAPPGSEAIHVPQDAPDATGSTHCSRSTDVFRPPMLLTGHRGSKRQIAQLKVRVSEAQLNLKPALWASGPLSTVPWYPETCARTGVQSMNTFTGFAYMRRSCHTTHKSTSWSGDTKDKSPPC